MPVALYFDVHVPQAIADQLRRRGVDVISAVNDDSATLEDDAYLNTHPTSAASCSLRIFGSKHWPKAGSVNAVFPVQSMIRGRG